MRRVIAFVLAVFAFTLAGCSGDVSRATVTLGESAEFSRTDLQAAADVVLADFPGCTPCTLLQLTYDEDFSADHLWLATDVLPAPGADVVVFGGSFSVDWRGQEYGLNANSTYENMTWVIARSEPGAAWTLVNKGVA